MPREHSAPDVAGALEALLASASRIGELIGAGRSATVCLLKGCHPQAQFDDEDVTHLGIEARKVGMVFQACASFQNITVA